MTPAVHLELLGRPGCSLCDKARDALLAAAAERSVRLELDEVDIDGDDDLLRRYLIRIPVLRFAGRELCEGVIRLPEARAALATLAVGR